MSCSFSFFDPSRDFSQYESCSDGGKVDLQDVAFHPISAVLYHGDNKDGNSSFKLLQHTDDDISTIMDQEDVEPISLLKREDGGRPTMAVKGNINGNDNRKINDHSGHDYHDDPRLVDNGLSDLCGELGDQSTNFMLSNALEESESFLLLQSLGFLDPYPILMPVTEVSNSPELPACQQMMEVDANSGIVVSSTFHPPEPENHSSFQATGDVLKGDGRHEYECRRSSRDVSACSGVWNEDQHRGAARIEHRCQVHQKITGSVVFSGGEVQPVSLDGRHGSVVGPFLIPKTFSVSVSGGAPLRDARQTFGTNAHMARGDSIESNTNMISATHAQENRDMLVEQKILPNHPLVTQLRCPPTPMGEIPAYFASTVKCTPLMPTLLAGPVPQSKLPQQGRYSTKKDRPQRTTNAIPLSLIYDATRLSAYQGLIRQQLELFEATALDVHTTQQGRKKKLSVGQVGIRCKHCVNEPANRRGRAAAYFPSTLEGIYQAAQNMASYHLCGSCQSIPLSLKERIRSLRKQKGAIGGRFGKKYWAEGCRWIGLKQTAGKELRLAPRDNSYNEKTRMEKAVSTMGSKITALPM